MDCQIPVVGGYQATQGIRQQEVDKSKKMVIIGLTASAMISDREKCLAAEMDDYLCKPLFFNDLADMLEQWLSKPSFLNNRLQFLYEIHCHRSMSLDMPINTD